MSYLNDYIHAEWDRNMCAAEDAYDRMVMAGPPDDDYEEPCPFDMALSRWGRHLVDVDDFDTRVKAESQAWVKLDEYLDCVRAQGQYRRQHNEWLAENLGQDAANAHFNEQDDPDAYFFPDPDEYLGPTSLQRYGAWLGYPRNVAELDHWHMVKAACKVVDEHHEYDEMLQAAEQVEKEYHLDMLADSDEVCAWMDEDTLTEDERLQAERYCH